MINWIKTEIQEYPTNAQELDNFMNTRNNSYLGVLVETHRGKRVENVLPLQLWINEFGCKYWTVYGETGEVTPIKWCLMPDAN